MQTIQPVDMAALKKKELSIKDNKFTFKEISPEDLFNMLQDLRHLVLFDVRSDIKPQDNHIRDSNMIADFVGATAVSYFGTAFDQYDKKFELQEEKYKTKRIRRLCIVDDASKKFDESTNVHHKSVMDAIRDYKDFNKVLYLKGGFQAFEKKYPFLCLNFDERRKFLEDQKRESVQPNKEIDDYTKKLLYAYSRFPYEIIPGKLFLGGIINANNARQRTDLKIKTLVDFTQYETPVKDIDEKTKGFTYKNVPVAEGLVEILDLDEICKYLDSLISNESEHPVLIFCKDGEVFSPGIAIAYLMYSKKMKVDMASLVVFQKTSTVNVNPKLYSLLQVYDPKKTVKV